jgi:hypothetical protein
VEEWQGRGECRRDGIGQLPSGSYEDLKETPVVLIDADALECNLRRMASYRRTHNLALHRHTKTLAAAIP